MNDKSNKSSALFTPSGCLTGDALMLFVSGSLKGASLLKAQKHISECPLCADAADGLRMWLKETESGETIALETPGKPEPGSSDLSRRKPNVYLHANKSSGKPANEFHARTDVLNERIKQRLHTHSIIEASENKRIPYKPFVWLAAAASIVILIGSFYVVWVQNQADKLRIDKQRAAEMAMLESAASSDTITFTLPEDKTMLAMKMKKEKGTKESSQTAAVIVNEDAEVLNQDELNATSKAAEITEAQPAEEIAVMKEEAKVSAVQKAIPAPSGKNAKSATKSGINEAEDSPVFTLVEEMPSFPGGDAERNKFLAENIVYPQLAMESGIQGTVYMSFIVNTDGKIADVKIIRGIGGGCDEEALRVVKLMPNWKPGRQNGKTVRTLFNMPVYFKLQ